MTFAMKQTLLAAAVGVGCVGMVMDVRPAAAATFTWTLNNVEFLDGTTAVGSFDFDTHTSTYSNVNITVNNPIPSNGVPGFIFPSVFTDADIDAAFSGTTSLFLGPQNNGLLLGFFGDLDSGDTTLSTAFSTYGNFSSGDISITFGGTVSRGGATPVPAPPGVLGLLLSGALAAHKARKSQRAAALAEKATV